MRTDVPSNASCHRHHLPPGAKEQLAARRGPYWLDAAVGGDLVSSPALQMLNEDVRRTIA